MTLGERLRQQPTRKTLNRMTLPQRVILNMLEGGRDSVLVHGAYIGDVFSLQAQDLVTSRLTDSRNLEVRLKP